MLVAATLVVFTLALAAANGANDVSKGIATLVGSGVTNYRGAVIWGSLCTLVGAVVAAFASQALVATFSGKGLLAQPVSSLQFLLAIACGAVGWLVIATRLGLPVSTTHSLAGALIGTAVFASGVQGVIWSAVLGRVALPLLVSPLLSMAILFLVLPLIRPLVAKVERYCVCLEQKEAVTPEGVMFRDPLGSIEVGNSCTTAVARVSAIDTLHWISSGATSFFRGVNDAPKILALGIAAGAILGVRSGALYALVAVAMGAGSLVAGFRVTRTLAEKITPIGAANGFAANAVTSVLVGLASSFALPVSTTHVSSGAIIGVGISEGGRAVRWKTVREMLLAWIVTLPASAILAGTAYALMR